jgi:hypothetical protein
MKTDIAQERFRHPILRELLLWLEEETGFEFTETSSFRIDDKGVHGSLPVRGEDLRCRNTAIGTVIQDFINDNWLYDPKRLVLNCCLLHGKGSNLHLHIQVHPNTVKR